MTPEKTIVTVEGPTGFSSDFELPLTVPFGKWKGNFIELLQQMDAKEFGAWRDMELRIGDKTIGPQETLAQHAAWDGSILKITRC